MRLLVSHITSEANAHADALSRGRPDEYEALAGLPSCAAGHPRWLPRERPSVGFLLAEALEHMARADLRASPEAPAGGVQDDWWAPGSEHPIVPNDHHSRPPRQPGTAATAALRFRFASLPRTDMLPPPSRAKSVGIRGGPASQGLKGHKTRGTVPSPSVTVTAACTR